MIIREYKPQDINRMIQIWNEVVESGIAFPQEDLLTKETGVSFFSSQTYCAVAVEEANQEVVGLYILHPNILENSLFWIVLKKPKNTDLRYCSLMQSLKVIFMQDIYMKDLDSFHWELFQMGLE